jgi:hypothetical protein
LGDVHTEDKEIPDGTKIILHIDNPASIKDLEYLLTVCRTSGQEDPYFMATLNQEGNITIDGNNYVIHSSINFRDVQMLQP